MQQECIVVLSVTASSSWLQIGFDPGLVASENSNNDASKRNYRQQVC